MSSPQRPWGVKVTLSSGEKRSIPEVEICVREHALILISYVDQKFERVFASGHWTEAEVVYHESR